MIFGKTKLELKVGLFVFIGLLILVVFVLSIGSFKTWSSGYRIHLSFNFANGLKHGAPVRFAGVDVGEVKDIRVVFVPEENKVRVDITIWVKNSARIPSDSRVLVNTLGLLGEKYVEIMPGKDHNNPITPGQSLVGEDPMPMHEVTQLAKDIATKLDDGIGRINNKEGTVGKLLYDDTIYKELEAFVTDIRKNPWKLFIKGKEVK